MKSMRHDHPLNRVVSLAQHSATLCGPHNEKHASHWDDLCAHNMNSRAVSIV